MTHGQSAARAAAIRTSLGGFGLWVRAERKARRWDLQIARSVLLDDEYRLEPLAASGRRVRHVLDIGAHIGTFTLKTKSLWPRSRVVAVEPDPDNATLFRSNTAQHADVALEEAAAVGASRAKSVHLRQAGRANPDHNAAASRVAEIVGPLDPKARPATAEVRAIGAAELVRRFGDGRIDLLKLDCEAAEAEVLSALSAAGLMSRIGSIRGEWHFAANRPAIEQALRATHSFRLEAGSGRCGALTAEPLIGRAR